jgi:two-component system response regulator AtoC
MAETLLIIEDEALLGMELVEGFAEQGWEVAHARSIAEAEALLFDRELEPLVVVSDMSLPDGNALDLLERVRARGLPGEWILLTAYGGVPESVRALKLGAFDFLEKPCDQERLDLVVAGAARSAGAQRRLRDEQRVRGARYTPRSFVGRSPAAREVRELIGRLGKVPFSALIIEGKTGTGKGLAARILHHTGPRAGGPLVEVNCAALPRELLESELFGHEAGAFTGARGRRRGLIEQADKGTLFLDELGELDADLQAKLLTAIEDRSVRRLGGDRPIAVDIQLIAATNRDLEAEVRAGRFRADLYHRLSVFRLDLPALRTRTEDLRDLLPVFVEELNAKAGKRVRVVPEAVWRRLMAYDWPGNVRELRNVVERCVLLADGEVFPERWLHLKAAPALPREAGEAAGADGLCLPMDGSLSFDDMERRILSDALERHGFNVSVTARRFGTTREKLRYRIQKYRLKAAE